MSHRRSGALRRVVLPAVLTGPPLLAALLLAFRQAPLARLLDLSPLDWLSALVWSPFAAAGYLGVLLPAVHWLARRRLPAGARAALLLPIAGAGGAAMAMIFALGVGEGVGLGFLALIAGFGAFAGLVATLIWLPFNLDLLRASNLPFGLAPDL